MSRLSPILGRPIDSQEHYIIVGGGISGLMIGFFLKEAGISFEIREASNRVGGLINTIDGPMGKVETGANGILWCEEIDYVAQKLGLQPIQPNQKEKKRFFVRNKKLRQFPLSIWETFEFAIRLLTPHKGDFKTVADFGNAYFGAAATNQILSPGLSGIYATSAEKLSFRGAGKLIASILDYSRWLPLALIRNRRANKFKDQALPKGLHSFEGGMITLVSALSDYLSKYISIDTKISVLNPEQQYILTTPAHVSKELIHSSTLADLLKKIHYQQLISATLFFRKDQFSSFKPGFGCLIPRDEGLKSLGVLFTSIIYPERIKNPNMLSLRCILHQDDETRQMCDDQLISFLENELDQLFALKGEAHDAVIHRWEQGLPIYDDNLYQLWPQLNHELTSNHPNIRLFGNYTGEISVRGACQTTFNMFRDLDHKV